MRGMMIGACALLIACGDNSANKAADTAAQPVQVCMKAIAQSQETSEDPMEAEEQAARVEDACECFDSYLEDDEMALLSAALDVEHKPIPAAERKRRLDGLLRELANGDLEAGRTRLAQARGRVNSFCDFREAHPPVDETGAHGLDGEGAPPASAPKNDP